MPRPKANPHILELRHRLLHVAGEVFAEHGFRGATVREITERAGVNLAAINYHFRDKAELYVSVLREAHFCAGLALAPATRGTPRAQLQAFLTSMLTALLDPARPAWQNRLLSREIAEPSPALDEIIETSMRPRGEQLFALLRGVAGADLPREKLAWLSCSIMGQCLHFSTNRVVIERRHPALAGYHKNIPRLAAHITDFSVPAVQAAGRQHRLTSSKTGNDQPRDDRPVPVVGRRSPLPGGRAAVTETVVLQPKRSRSEHPLNTPPAKTNDPLRSLVARSTSKGSHAPAARSSSRRQTSVRTSTARP